MNDLLPIGEVAHRSGLSVSALRFYDGEGVLRPDYVDAVTGYRRYAPEQIGTARLVAGLRRVGMPIAEIREAVEHQADRELIAGLLDRHLARLESGLVDARREIDRLHSMLVPHDGRVTATVAMHDLRRLLAAVRFAVGHDAAHPVLRGALLHIGNGVVRLVATDRYRLAVHEVPGRTSGAADGIVPDAALGDLAAHLEAEQDATGAVALVLEPDRLSASVGEHTVQTVLVEGDYPDYRRILSEDPEPSIPWDDSLVEPGSPAVGLATLTGEAPVVVRHEFLLDAVAAAGTPAMLRLDGPISPLVIRAADGATSVLMPTRAEVGS